ncbi:MAG: protein kinase [Actinomycetota bacterium]|nr:protein kinase [Actinomycetota bacterium]
MVEGTLLSDRYRIEERLATGGMGAVYAATDQRLGRRVAVKVLKEGLADDQRFVERFRREARAAGALSHPNVAGVYDFAEHAGRHYMVMELAQGRDLSWVLREEGPLSPERAARIGSRIARALAHAHAAGVVHRDIKPANVIVDDSDKVKVTDFGIARAVGDSSLTATGSMLGTAHYISPEQASAGEVGPRSDIYSLGIVVYEMLTGTLPYTGDSAIAVAMRHVSEEVPAPSAINGQVPQALDAFVARATAKDPKDRFADAGHMATALEETLGGTVETPTAAMGVAAPAAATAAMTGAAAGATQTLGQTVWPIPGERWDPQRLGRRVVLFFAALSLIALLLLLFRLGGDEQPAAAVGGQEQVESPIEEPVAEETAAEPSGNYVLSEDVIGADYREVEEILKEAGLSVGKEDVDSDEFPKDAVVATDPPPGTELEEGDAVTLFVSKGEDFEEEDDDEGPPGHSKGKGPKEKDD